MNDVPNFQPHFVSLCFLIVSIISSDNHCAFTNGLEMRTLRSVFANVIIRLRPIRATPNRNGTHMIMHSQQFTRNQIHYILT